MPDPTNLEQLQAQKAYEAYAAEKLAAVRRALSVFDLAWSGQALDYLTLVDRLHTVLGEELASLTAPPKG